MSTHQVVAGWYPDPNDATRDRYWDGQDWRDARPRPPAPPQHADDDRVGPASIAVAILIPLFGLIIAIAAFARGRNRTGIAVLLTSIVTMIIWYILVVR